MIEAEQKNLGQQFIDVNKEVLIDLSATVRIIAKAPYYLLRGTLFAARNKKSLMDWNKDKNLGLDSVIEAITDVNCIFGNLALGAAAYHYGGARGLAVYALTSSVTNLGAVLENTYRKSN